jgi:L-seryl-tRNA(Ser) seleniumtransferase
MISASSDELRARAEHFAGMLGDLRREILAGSSLIGGGATPQQPLPAWLIAIECPDVVGAERRCRLGDPPVIARIENGRLLLDIRTVSPPEEDELARVVREACSQPGE